MGQIDHLNYQSIRKQSEWLFKPSLILLSIDYKIMGQIDLKFNRQSGNSQNVHCCPTLILISIDHNAMGRKDHLTIDQWRSIQNGYSWPSLVMISIDYKPMSLIYQSIRKQLGWLHCTSLILISIDNKSMSQIDLTIIRW